MVVLQEEGYGMDNCILGEVLTECCLQDYKKFTVSGSVDDRPYTCTLKLYLRQEWIENWCGSVSKIESLLTRILLKKRVERK